MINPIRVDVWHMVKIVILAVLLCYTLMNQGFTLGGAIIVLCCVVGIPGNIAQLSQIDSTREIQ